MIDYQTALALACKQRPQNVTESMAAEIMVNAEQQFWYFMLSRWIEAPPPGVAESSRPMFVECCETTKEIIDRGWNFSTDKKIAAVEMLLVMELGTMVSQLANVIPASFPVVFELLLGRGWPGRYKKALTALAKKK